MSDRASEWRTIASVPNLNYGDVPLSKLIRIALALGYALEDVEIGRGFDEAGFETVTLEVHQDLFVTEQEREPLEVVSGISTISTLRPAALPPPSSATEPVTSTSLENFKSVADSSKTCPDCGRGGFADEGGLNVHRARAHKQLSGGGKVCAEDGCETLLSKYNPSKWCGAHESNHPPSHFGSFSGTRRGPVASA